ncbi:PDR/VanB family oxidoreductase [Psychromicrobium xiongbiense]|uniref:PDR/VanB family oxidoreductase n=1 Tax=Psychromicrobium xiongbiense TaxID=3051184 RepID=UPI002556D636|nr:PDR/VanB family oxidoreductase [Psychromicrobium sp. YIM S02556]
MSADLEFDLIVTAKSLAADGIVLLRLEPAEGEPLPAWRPGAHIDLILQPEKDGHLERQYSLCGDPDDAAWQIGVLREPEGRGGSLLVHDELAVGTRLRARGPRNHFAFDPEASERSVFIAGGIGITPILSMISEAERVGHDWQLIYAGRSRRTMAFVDQLVETHPERVRVFAADEGNRLDLTATLAEPAPGTAVYCCGPARLMEAVEELSRHWPHGTLHLERFVPRHFDEPAVQESFEVELELSGMTLTVPPDRSILDVVDEAGVLVLSSCREGTCGTCETPVISGAVDHRDSVLTPDEQADNSVMMICVSRAACPRLVLEL